ncbi:MAG: hypothetical protein AAB706_00955, partial [Patescibacteria group bacterium]
ASAYAVPQTGTTTPSSNLPAQASALQTSTLPAQGGLPTPPVFAQDSNNQFLQSYLQSLSPTSAETELQGQQGALESQLRNLNQGQGVMNANLEDQPIALPFITGQQAAVEKRYALQRGDVTNQQLTIQRKLALEQAKRQSAIDVSKTSLDYATGQQGRTDTLTQQQYQNQTEAQKYQNMLAQQQYENQLAQQKNTPTTASQNVPQTTVPQSDLGTTTTVAGLNSGKTFISGSLQYTAQAFQEDQATLLNPNITDAQGNPNRGPDGYVNPAVYLKLYNSWIAGGGLKSDFLQIYPIKDYINPANTWPEIIALGGGTKPKAATTSTRSI